MVSGMKQKQSNQDQEKIEENISGSSSICCVDVDS